VLQLGEDRTDPLVLLADGSQLFREDLLVVNKGVPLNLQLLSFQLDAFCLVLPTGDPALIRARLAVGILQGFPHLGVVAP